MVNDGTVEDPVAFAMERHLEDFLVVVELKRGRASDSVVGQTLRYMGYVDEMLANPDQTVRGAIVASEGDDRIKRALRMTPSIELYLYKIDFKLQRSE